VKSVEATDNSARSPTVSAVLPTRNGSRYIDRAIESVVEQTFADWELIVVDDASTDDTAAKIDAWARRDERIRSVHLEENRKLPGALNEGFRLAKGDYLTWTSDDNWYAPEAFAPRWVSPFPDGSYLALVQSDDTHEIHLVDFDEPDDPVYTAFTADLDAALGGAVSPLNFIAVVMDGRPWIFGADPAGELFSRAAGPDALAVLPDQIDWSPDNTRLVATVNSAGGPNLVIIDANEGTLRTLTVDGRSSMPAWFGR